MLVTYQCEMVFQPGQGTMVGGIFERLIRSAMRCLRKIIGRAKLTYDELLTVVALLFIINSWPLSYVTPDDFEEPLTPSHLLMNEKTRAKFAWQS